MGNRKALIIFTILLVLVIIAGGFLLFLIQHERTMMDQPAEIKTSIVPASKAPAGLPENLPMDPGSQILQNYEATTQGDRISGTRRFTTKKSPQLAVKTYQDFFAKTAWQVVEQKEESGYNSVLMQRNESTVLILAREELGTDHNVVEITLTEIKK